MLLKDTTYKVQQSLASYCRNDEEVKIPGAIQSRLATYRRLVYNVAKDTLESAFPITAKYIDAEVFEEMISSFFEQHDNTSPLLWKMPLAFYQFSLEKEFSIKYDLPFLNDLLWFEWLEIQVFMMEDEPYPIVQNEGDLFKDELVFNPEYRLEKLSYPIHIKEPKEALKEKGDYYLLLYREQDSGKVQFVNLSMLYAYVLERLLNEGGSINLILDDILYFFAINDIDLLKSKLHTFISDLKNRGFILGFKN